MIPVLETLGVILGACAAVFLLAAAGVVFTGWREARRDRRHRPIPVPAVETVPPCATEDLPPLPAWWSTSDVVSGAQRAYAEGAAR